MPTDRHLPDELPRLTDGTVTLRSWEPSDAPAVVEACRDPEIPRWTTMRPGLDEPAASDWIARWRGAIESDRAAPFAIVGADHGLLGSVGLGNFDWPEQTGEAFYWLAAEARGKGFAVRAVRLVCAWGFGTLGLARIELFAHPDNDASHRVAERAGFTREGVLRSKYIVKGERWDLVLFSLLPADTAVAPIASEPSAT